MPCVSGTDPLLLRALGATLNCPLMWSFSVFVHGFPRKFRKITRQCPRRLRKSTSRCLTGPSKALVWTQAAQSPCPVLVCSTPERRLCSRRCSPRWGSLNGSWGPRARVRQSGALRLPPGPALGLCAGASGAAPAHVPVLMEGLSSSPLRLEREWLGLPLLPTQQALSFGVPSFTLVPAVSRHPQTFSSWRCERSRHQAHGCRHCPARLGTPSSVVMRTGLTEVELAGGVRNSV